MRNVLITTSEVIFHAPTKHTLDPRTISQSIIIAEERFIRPVLGFDFYYDLVNTKNIEVTAGNVSDLQIHFSQTLNVGDVVNASELLSSNYLSLWKQCLWKLTAEAVMITAFPEAFIQFASEGIVHTAPTAGPMTGAGVVTPDLKSVKWALDKKVMDRIDPLTESLKSYICLNPANYPLYKDCPSCAQTPATKRTDLVTGIYDDQDFPRCGCPGLNDPFRNVY